MELVLNRQTTKCSVDYSPEHKEIIEKAIEYANSIPNCAGLAANQIIHEGKDINIRFFIHKEEERTYAICNPKVINYIGSPTKLIEGCLSWPEKDIVANRYNNVVLQYETIDGEKKTETFSGFDAQVCQHEIDHLDGIEEEIYPKGQGAMHLSNTKVGRNDPCPCGSGKKFKKCCG
jgi:peptide deformylase